VTSSYSELLSAAKEHPETADFTALRLAFTTTDAYNPNLSPDPSIGKLFRENKVEAAVEAVGKSLEQNYIKIQTHMMAADVYRKLNLETKVAYHGTWVTGLLRSIFDSGNGRSFETAFVVIETGEEYALLGVLGAQLTRQSLVQHDRHQFDVMDVTNAKTGQALRMYFNIDTPMKWLVQNRSRKHFGTS